MRNAPFQIETKEFISDARSKFGNRNDGVEISMAGITFRISPTDLEKKAARQIVTFLKDRRVLNCIECCDDCIDHSLESLQEIRKFIMQKQIDLSTLEPGTNGPLFLLNEFSLDAIRQFLTYHERLEAAAARVPPASENPDFRRPQGIRDDYFDALKTLRAHLHGCIQQISVIASISHSKVPDNAKLRILFLSANPLDSAPLRLDAELRNIREKLDLSKATDEVEMCQEWAVRITDLQRVLLKNDPTVVHFSGHGSDKGEIVLEDATGNSQAVSADALAALFKAFRESVRCVVLNSCDSESQANGIVEHVDVVITMSDEVDDDAANAFASGFYQALVWGRSIQQAFDLGCNQMALEGFADADVPVLKVKKGIDPSTMYLFGIASGSAAKNAEAKARGGS